jgi:hypothetical protein
MNFTQTLLPYVEEIFLAVNTFKRIAKNPLFEAISLHGPTGPLYYQFLKKGSTEPATISVLFGGFCE